MAEKYEYFTPLKTVIFFMGVVTNETPEINRPFFLFARSVITRSRQQIKYVSRKTTLTHETAATNVLFSSACLPG